MAVSGTRLTGESGVPSAGNPVWRPVTTVLKAIANVARPVAGGIHRREPVAALAPSPDAAARLSPVQFAFIDTEIRSPAGREACALLVGVAGALSMLYDSAGADDGPSRTGILSSPELTARLEQVMRSAPPHTFDGALQHVHPLVLIAAAAVLEHATIASLTPRPDTMGGFPLADILLSARRLACEAPPFDRIVPSLDETMQEERYIHGR